MAKNKKLNKKAIKSKIEKIDGLSPKDIKNLRRAIRQVWTWSQPWRIAKARNIGPEGFPICEKCKKTVPKTFVDHIETLGEVDSGFIERCFVPSKQLQNLCKDCHKAKTKVDNLKTKVKRLNKEDFY